MVTPERPRPSCNGGTAEVGRGATGEVRKLPCELGYALALRSRSATVTSDRINRAQSAAFEPPTMATRLAKPVRLVKRLDMAKVRPYTARTMTSRSPYLLKAGRNERVAEDFHHAPPITLHTSVRPPHDFGLGPLDP
jgi:hypothetical protein